MYAPLGLTRAMSRSLSQVWVRLMRQVSPVMLLVPPETLIVSDTVATSTMARFGVLVYVI